MTSFFASPEVRVAEASAGSGKTYALSKRYVQLLLHSARTPLAVKHILAITFTNKAAGSMKSRILDLLKNLALGTLPKAQAEDLLKPLGMDASQAVAPARVIMQEIIRNYHFFQVQTIDSFMNALLAGCAFKIDLSARFKIQRNAGDYLQLSLDELIDQAQVEPDLKVLFENFIRQYLFLENRGSWFPKEDLLAVLNGLFNQYNTYQKPFLSFPLSSSSVIEDKRQFLKLARRLQEILPAETDKRFLQSLENFLKNHPEGFDLDQVSRYFGRPAAPLKSGVQVSSELEDLWQTMGQLLREICLQEAYGVFNPYVDLFEAVMARLGRLQTKEDVLFLQQLNKKASDLFDDELITVEELYYRLATRFRHYLLDEFQDTSLSQWRNLQVMVEEALSSGGTLFYVGDKKQAIYSFRGGQSGLFDQLQQDFANYNVVQDTLSRNFRSHKIVIDFNNRIFHVDNLRSFMLKVQEEDRLKDKDIAFNPQDWRRLEAVFSTSQQSAGKDLPGGSVRVEIIAGRRKQERLGLLREKILAAVRSAHERFAWGDIAILTRNNAQVQMVTQWLVEEGIYAQSERTSDVKNHPLVREMAAFVRFLFTPSDNTAFTEVLLGRLFPKVSGLTPAQIQEFLFSCRRSKSASQECHFYKMFRDAYPQIWTEYFEEFLNQSGIYPLYELAVSFCGRWRIMELFPQTQGFVMHFLELVKRREEENCDVETFLQYFETFEDEDRFVPMPPQDAVRVLTVHKAKGLEFPVVIIPFLEMAIRPGAGVHSEGPSFICGMEQEGMRLLRLKDSYMLFSEELRERYALEYKECFFAELNNVYVALTRAICEMHVFVPERTANSANVVSLLIPQELFSTGQPVAGKSQIKPFSARLLPPAANQQWLSKLQEEFLREPASQARVRLQGEVRHYTLSKIGNLTDADAAKALDEAIALGRERFGDEYDWPLIRQKIGQLVAGDKAREFFYLPHAAQVMCELELVNSHGDTRRLDRLIVLPKEILIVDFKTSDAHAAQHRKQLKEYQALVQKLYPSHMVRADLVFFDG